MITRYDDRYAVAKFSNPEFGAKQQKEVPLFWKYSNFLITQCGIGQRKPHVKTSSIRSAVSIALRLVIDRQTDRQTDIDRQTDRQTDTGP